MMSINTLSEPQPDSASYEEVFKIINSESPWHYLFKTLPGSIIFNLICVAHCQVSFFYLFFLKLFFFIIIDPVSWGFWKYNAKGFPSQMSEIPL